MAACEADTIDHAVMMNGIHLSAPSFFEMRPLGSSAARNEARKIYVGQFRLDQPRVQSADSITYCLSIVEIICVHAQFRQHVIRDGTIDVPPIQVERAEHEPSPKHDAKVDLEVIISDH